MLELYFCPACDRLVMLSSNPLCSACAERLNSFTNPGLWLNVADGVEVLPLYLWPPGESSLLSRLLLRLKKSGQRAAWLRFAQSFQKHFPWDGLPQQRTHLYFPRPRSADRQHSQHWAEGLALALGPLGRVQPCPMTLATKEPFKKQNRKSRYRGIERTERCEGAQQYAADDVVTTGATATHIRRRLGAKKIVVFALAYRTTLAQARKLC